MTADLGGLRAPALPAHNNSAFHSWGRLSAVHPAPTILPNTLSALKPVLQDLLSGKLRQKQQRPLGMVGSLMKEKRFPLY